MSAVAPVISRRTQTAGIGKEAAAVRTWTVSRCAPPPSNDFVQGRARAQEELGLESPNCHLHERAPIGDVEHTSAHARAKDGKAGRMSFQNNLDDDLLILLPSRESPGPYSALTLVELGDT